MKQAKLPEFGTTIFTVISRYAQEKGAINLSQGFPDFDCSPDLVSRAQYYFAQGINQYAPMPGTPVLRKAIAAKVQHFYELSLDPEQEITVTAGATEAISSAIATFIFPGDEVIIFEPAYDSYRPCILINGGVPVVIALRSPAYQVDWEAVGRAVTPRTKMIIFNNPHNPTGQIWGEQDLLQLEALAEEHDLLVLSDEAYEHLVFEGKVHQSVLRFPRLFQRSLVAFSFGKTYHITGWRVGYLVAPPALTKAFRKVHQFTVFTINTPIQFALAEYMQDRQAVHDLADFFHRKYRLLLDYLQRSRFKIIPSQGTYFVLADYSAISSAPDDKFIYQLMDEHGLATIPLSAFYTHGSPDPLIRFCFGKKDETIHAAGKIIERL